MSFKPTDATSGHILDATLQAVRKERSRNRYRMVLTMVAGLAAVTGLIVHWQNDRKTESGPMAVAPPISQDSLPLTPPPLIESFSSVDVASVIEVFSSVDVTSVLTEANDDELLAVVAVGNGGGLVGVEGDRRLIVFEK